MDTRFPIALRERCGEHIDESPKRVFIVIQLKEDMESFSAIDGQCIKIEHDGIEELAIVDCADAYTPHPDERTSSINTVLSAIKIEFEITEALEKLFDARCYRTDGGGGCLG